MEKPFLRKPQLKSSRAVLASKPIGQICGADQKVRITYKRGRVSDPLGAHR